MAVFNKNINLNISFSYIEKALHLPMGHFEKYKTGDFISRLEDIQKIQYILPDIVMTLFMDSFMIIILGIVLFFQSSVLFTVSVIFIILSTLIFMLFMKFYRDSYQKLSVENADTRSYIIELLSGFKLVKALNAEKIVFQRFHKKQTSLAASSYKISIMAAGQSLLYDLTRGWGNNILFWIGSYYILQDTLTIGTLLSFNTLLTYFMNPLYRLLNIQRGFQEAIISFNRVTNILKTDADAAAIEKLIIPSKIHGNISINNIAFEYEYNKPILKNITMEIHKGDRIALVGQSGCGKTTLIQLLMRYYSCGSGAIFIDDHNILDIDPNYLRSRIGYVPQDVFLFSDTIANNISLQKPDASLEEIIEVSKRSGCHEFIEKLPERYNTILSERGASLSGGQRQKIAIARSLIANPDLLIFDEPSSNLDTISERQLNTILDNLSYDNTTCIIIAHRLSTVINCTNIFVMNDGMIMERGTHKELINMDGLYAALWK
jgi:ATP-binding cassette subfamily B protein